jgi:hypothetical protein
MEFLTHTMFYRRDPNREAVSDGFNLWSESVRVRLTLLTAREVPFTASSEKYWFLRPGLSRSFKPLSSVGRWFCNDDDPADRSACPRAAPVRVRSIERQRNAAVPTSALLRCECWFASTPEPCQMASAGRSGNPCAMSTPM